MNNGSVKFSHKIYMYTILITFTCSAIFFVFTSFFSMMTVNQVLWAFISFMAVYIFAHFVVLPVLNKFSSRSVDNGIELFEKGEIKSDADRTVLYKMLVKFPVKKAREIFVFTCTSTGILAILYYRIPNIDLTLSMVLVSYFCCVFGCYISSLIIFSYTEKLTNSYAEELIIQGISEDDVEHKDFFGKKKQWFGIPIFSRIMLFLFLPVVLSNILSFLILKQGYINIENTPMTSRDLIVRVLFSTAFQVAIIVFLALIFYNYMKRNTVLLRDCSTELLLTGNSNMELRTSRTDQIQYNVFLLKKIIAYYESIMSRFSDIGKNVLQSTESLSEISDKIFSSSTEQNGDVKEILSTMEDSNSLSKNVSNRISEVSQGIDSTQYEVSEAFYLLKENIQQLMDINSSNKIVIDGIKKLAGQIDSIDDIVKIIEDISDQTKIIAFNAELEAISNGKEGRNFHIVATEIRRLANSTMDSIDKIKKYIDTIQSASKDLIQSAEKNTILIQDESVMTKELEAKFSEIMDSSNATNEKTSEITGTIEQQTASFNQIVITLRQISSGIESFALSTKTIAGTVNEMKNVAFKLSNMND